MPRPRIPLSRKPESGTEPLPGAGDGLPATSKPGAYDVR